MKFKFCSNGQAVLPTARQNNRSRTKIAPSIFSGNYATLAQFLLTTPLGATHGNKEQSGKKTHHEV
ncbi:MAG: hypothetical protein ACYDHM_05200 [Acidiferrobacterales bacterium]